MANWADLPADMISELTFYLKGDEYDRFRAVCKGWRERTEERAPQLILMNFAENDNTINALAFFDIVCKIVKPVSPSVFRAVQGSHYMGSSHGWLFLGRYLDGNLHVSLLDPFARKESLITLPPLGHQPQGCVAGRILVSQQPSSIQLKNHNLVVVYCSRDVNGDISSRMRFIKPVQERVWGSVWLGKPPSDILSMDGGFYVNFDGVLSLVDIENEDVLEKCLSLPGLSRELSSDPSLSLRKRRGAWVPVHNYHPSGLLVKMSYFWCNRSTRYIPVGWIASA
ncbi:uncharacterized protein LOC120280469 [Dioscorea cayenensis subsp. rotundata]|uniref:Uncharacterized protein LOC120280469 n=1 Tax=Dioscorea cayennensis subsp. rotundata TaxID=55577 RepID=A0AB40CT40_DIOCR|nr:uncharacterized protein LOC120280469 [Dioscorea cayenensis subsp. rotundata]